MVVMKLRAMVEINDIVHVHTIKGESYNRTFSLEFMIAQRQTKPINNEYAHNYSVSDLHNYFFLESIC